MFTFIMTLVSAFFGVVGVILYDRFKRATPNYGFEFEKEPQYYGPGAIIGIYETESGCCKNYIRIKKSGRVPLHDLTTKIHFDTKKEGQYYQTLGLKEDIFKLKIECVLDHSPTPKESQLETIKTKEEFLKERKKQGFFIPDSTMEKLKILSPVKVKVEYTWEGKRGADIWLFDFSDGNEVRFGMSSPTFWQKIKLIFKRIF